MKAIFAIIASLLIASSLAAVAGHKEALTAIARGKKIENGLLQAYSRGYALRKGFTYPTTQPSACQKQEYTVDEAVACVNAQYPNSNNHVFVATPEQIIETLAAKSNGKISANALKSFGKGFAARYKLSLPSSLPHQCKKTSFTAAEANLCLKAAFPDFFRPLTAEEFFEAIIKAGKKISKSILDSYLNGLSKKLNLPRQSSAPAACSKSEFSASEAMACTKAEFPADVVLSDERLLSLMTKNGTTKISRETLKNYVLEKAHRLKKTVDSVPK